MDESEQAKKRKMLWRRNQYLIPRVIEEVWSRPILWDKSRARECTRYKKMKEWDVVAAKLRLRPIILKKKWRNIKDTFHREAKRVVIKSDEIDRPLIEYYKGQWQYFESLLFLWDPKRHLKKHTSDDEVEVDLDSPREYAANVKIERLETGMDEEKQEEIKDFVDSEDEEMDETNFTDPIAIDKNDKSLDTNTASVSVASQAAVKREKIIVYEEVSKQHNIRIPAAKTQNGSVSNTDQEYVEKRKRCDQNCGVIKNCEIDEDLHFAKSLVPFMRQLNPIRKLIVRNEIHSILLNELLCSECKITGPRSNCECNN